ncbi:Mitochondrial distribution and morphology protein 31, mitochondrial precursor [Tieghemiomyces parasiticus]|uniref:Mitochondrial distribution and morphology protein 31, mitochondrial n=1 Tax=Tieghemiomyces parasiticus TaxID=78921 RepID=A0A9W8AN31_9FUNG|nr:Mitochondrial distribution and morphology protein 31, mitochondrial precursor [Tieghemiomyces parasiticus]
MSALSRGFGRLGLRIPILGHHHLPCPLSFPISRPVSRPLARCYYTPPRPGYYTTFAPYSAPTVHAPIPHASPTRPTTPIRCSTPCYPTDAVCRCLATSANQAEKRALLQHADTRWARWRIHIRYALTRGFRPWTVDDILGIFSWIFVSNALFVLIGTTTFFSLVLAIANGLSFEDYVAHKLGEYLMTLTGATFTFESSISPSWRNGHISLRNVSIHLGPEYAERERRRQTNDPRSQGRYTRFDDHYHVDGADGVDHGHGDPAAHQLDRNALNYTMYDLKVDQIDVTFSLWRWMDGKGLVKDCRVKGIRGVVDRTHVFWDPDVPYIPAEERARHRPGHFELESFRLEDALIYVHYPDNFPAFPISIFSASLPQLRQQWLLLDIISADSMVGTYDNCLFSIHRAQDPSTSIAATTATASSTQPSLPTGRPSVNVQGQLPNHVDPSSLIHAAEQSRCLIAPDHGSTVKKSHLRIDGVNISHLNAGAEGPFGWIHDGQVDVDAIITFPVDPHAEPLKKLVNELADDLEQAITQSPRLAFLDDPASSPSSPAAVQPGDEARLPSLDQVHRVVNADPARYGLSGDPFLLPSLRRRRRRHLRPTPDGATISTTDGHDPPMQLRFDLQVTLRNTRASVPLQTADLSYLNNALIRPIVAFVNAHRTATAIPCRFTMPYEAFDGAWSFYDSGFVDRASAEIGKGFVQLAYDERERNRRLKRVGLWGVQTVLRNLINVLDYVRGKRGFWHYLGLVHEPELN